MSGLPVSKVIIYPAGTPWPDPGDHTPEAKRTGFMYWAIHQIDEYFCDNSETMLHIYNCYNYWSRIIRDDTTDNGVMIFTDDRPGGEPISICKILLDYLTPEEMLNTARTLVFSETTPHYYFHVKVLDEKGEAVFNEVVGFTYGASANWVIGELLKHLFDEHIYSILNAYDSK